MQILIHSGYINLNESIVFDYKINLKTLKSRDFVVDLL